MVVLLGQTVIKLFGQISFEAEIRNFDNESNIMLHYKKKGNGFPIIFLHGFLESIQIWQPLKLGDQSFQSILIDLPGHGLSGMENVTANLSEYAKKVFEVIEKEELDEFGLVGHSMGGYIAMEMARQDNSIEKIILLNSNFWADSSLKKKERKRVLEILQQDQQRYLMAVIPLMFQFPKRDKVFIQEVVEQANTMSKGAIITATQAMMKRNDTENLASLLGKNLKIIHGELDTTVPLATLLEKTKDKSYNLSILKNTGHMSYIEASEDVMAIIQEFYTHEIQSLLR